MISLFQYVKAVDATAVEPDDWAVFGPHYFRAETQRGIVVLGQVSPRSYVLSLVTAVGAAAASGGEAVVSVVVGAEPTQADIDRVAQVVKAGSSSETTHNVPPESIQTEPGTNTSMSRGRDQPGHPDLGNDPSRDRNNELNRDPNAPPGFEDEFELQTKVAPPKGPALGPYGDTDLYPPGGRNPSLGPFVPQNPLRGGMSPFDPTLPHPSIRYDPTTPQEAPGASANRGPGPRDIDDPDRPLGFRPFGESGGPGGSGLGGSGLGSNGFSSNFGFGTGGSGNGFI